MQVVDYKQIVDLKKKMTSTLATGGSAEVIDERKRQLIEKYSGTTIRITMDDARIVKGKLECLDKDQNLILSDCYLVSSLSTAAEEHEESKSNEKQNQFLGFAMVPGPHVTKVEMKMS